MTDSPTGRRERGFGAAIGAQSDGIGREARRLRLNTLIRLRWLAVAGQAAAIVVSLLVLGPDFPVLACLALVAASAALNLWLRWRFPVAMQLSDQGATLLLGYDILQLSGLLFLTGGVANPFVSLILAPVVIAATALPLGRALGLLGLALACATALLAVSLPLPWLAGGALALPPLYLAARWAAFGIGAGFVSLYAYRVAEEARQTSSALTATEFVLARARHLSQLDGLAAAAAHELGTPLATVSLVVREMAAQPPPNASFADDLSLLEEQIDRCRAILAKLSSPAELSGEPMDISSPVELVEMAAAPHRLLGVAIAVTGEGPEPAPRCPRNPGVLFSLGALIENAVSFAESAVSIRASWSRSGVTITISDDGEGFPPGIIARVGEPYLSQRESAKRNEDAGGGLGLGLFIARSLLARSRATLDFANARPPEKGAVVTVEWSRQAYEEGRRPEP